MEKGHEGATGKSSLPSPNIPDFDTLGHFTL